MQGLADKLGLSLIEAANGIIEIANANMVGALRLVSVQRGFDPREFVLVAFGGAGPMHANALAQELSISKILIPMSPGLTTALGLLVCDIKHDYVRAYIKRTDAMNFGQVNEAYRLMEDQAALVLSSEGLAQDAMHFTRYVDMRYVGQSYELKIPAPEGGLAPADVAGLTAAFFREHARAYGYAATAEPTEVVNLRVTAIGSIPKSRLRELEAGSPDSQGATKGERDVYFGGAGSRARSKVYDRYLLKAGNQIHGPAIVEEVDSTVVIHPGWHCEIDRHGNILIER